MLDPQFTKPWHGVPRDQILWDPSIIEDALIARREPPVWPGRRHGSSPNCLGKFIPGANDSLRSEITRNPAR